MDHCFGSCSAVLSDETFVGVLHVVCFRRGADAMDAVDDFVDAGGFLLGFGASEIQNLFI